VWGYSAELTVVYGLWMRGAVAVRCTLLVDHEASVNWRRLWAGPLEGEQDPEIIGVRGWSSGSQSSDFSFQPEYRRK